MTRKRFIKLMMSHGISRNEAVKIAADYNSRNISYEKAYQKEALRRVDLAFKRLGKSFASATAAFKDLSTAMYFAMNENGCDLTVLKEGANND